jgi:hypothetical protein
MDIGHGPGKCILVGWLVLMAASVSSLNGPARWRTCASVLIFCSLGIWCVGERGHPIFGWPP